MHKTSERKRPRGSLMQYLGAAMAALAFVLTAFAVAMHVTDDEPAGPKILSADEAAELGNPVIELGEMYIRGDLSVGAAETISVINRGVAPHNLAVERGPRTPDLQPEKAAELDLSTLSDGAHTVYCTIEGHRAAGMEAELVVGL
jgi:plastocyanin